MTTSSGKNSCSYNESIFESDDNYYPGFMKDLGEKKANLTRIVQRRVNSSAIKFGNY